MEETQSVQPLWVRLAELQDDNMRLCDSRKSCMPSTRNKIGKTLTIRGTKSTPNFTNTSLNWIPILEKPGRSVQTPRKRVWPSTNFWNFLHLQFLRMSTRRHNPNSKISCHAPRWCATKAGSFFQRKGVRRVHARISVLGLAANRTGETRGCANFELRSHSSTRSRPHTYGYISTVIAFLD